MGKSNGRIQDWVKGGSGLRVTNGAAHVRIVGGSGGGSVTFPITQAQGGTGRSSAITQGQVVFAGATTYEGDSNFSWNNTTKALSVREIVSPILSGTPNFAGSCFSSNGQIVFTSPLIVPLMNVGTGATGIMQISTTSGRGQLMFDDGGFSTKFLIAFNGTVWQLGSTVAEDVQFITNNTDRGRIVSAGRWLFNTTTDDGVSTVQVAGAMTVSGNYNGAPTVTGSRASGAALVDLLTKLATSKIIVDGSTI